MPDIRILSDRVANQIAAGEVIERPVAVVKELVENSIDACATRIEVEFRNGGKSYIRITDNGKGMTPDEALLSLERHATSKIRETVDLNEIASFGFRGEALPSIASVSKFTLRTRAEGWEHGTEININGGKLLDKKECGMPVGTVIEVAQLFNSVPARRKFLKTDPTETAHITYTTRLFAVAHPKVAFRVLDNGRVVFQSPACVNLRDRIGEIWGRQLANDLIEVDAVSDSGAYRLTGLTAKPGIGRSTRRELVTLVNRRPVDSRTFGFAVLDAYHGRIQKGRYPPAFLFLEINPNEVDVNVHPAKREVRFRDDGAIRRFVLEAISKTLSDATERLTPATEKTAVEPSSPNKTVVAPTTPKVSPPTPAPVIPKSTATIAALPKPSPVKKSPALEPAVIKATAEAPTKPQTTLPSWQLISILRKRYALFETARGLIILHIRHADQRVRFENICSEFKSENIPSQRLLIPEPLELEPLAAAALLNHLELLNHQGFTIEEFGRNFFRIEALPTWLPIDQSENFVRDFVDLLRQRGMTFKNRELLWEAIAQLAIKSSYRKDDILHPDAAQNLANELLSCQTPHTSPFGKPTFTETSWNELERRLGNTD